MGRSGSLEADRHSMQQAAATSEGKIYREEIRKACSDRYHWHSGDSEVYENKGINEFARQKKYAGCFYIQFVYHAIYKRVMSTFVTINALHQNNTLEILWIFLMRNS